MQEIFKDIPDYEGIYQISNLGNVKSLKQEVIRKSKSFIPVKEKILKNNLCKNGYFVVNLYKDTKRSIKTVHRLILRTFIGKCPVGMEACHNNGIKTDNRLVNLRWDTRSANMKDSIKHKTFKTFFVNGENHSRAKVNNLQVRIIREYPKYYGYLKDLSDVFGITTRQINIIRKRDQWKHI